MVRDSFTMPHRREYRQGCAIQAARNSDPSAFSQVLLISWMAAIFLEKAMNAALYMSPILVRREYRLLAPISSRQLQY
jgi:hypothetical protein